MRKVLRQHIGEWITVQGHAERTPPRLTVSLALGELPQQWAAMTRPSTKPWTAIVGLLFILPFAAFIVASLLNGVGINAPMQWIGSSPASIIAVSVSVFVGIPVAFVLNLWRITHVGLRRRDGEVEGLLALEFAPLHLVVIALALIIGGLFVAHLAADSYACMNGVRSAC